MAPPRMNIMRSLRLQLKTGFLKKEPASYQFMKRYPPLHREDRKLETIKPNKKDIPYLDLYHKAVQRNFLNEEFVYPAYWREEPKALIIAKKQYQHMMNGDDEDTAYRKAEEYIDEIENKAYLELQSLEKALAEMGAQAPYMTDAALMVEIDQWKQKLQTVAYEDLDLADQGEIDHLLQTKIMRWGEVERGRRMKDPIFVMQFEKLRQLIFTEGEVVVKEKQRKERAEMKSDFYKMHRIDPEAVGASAPFYIEDYMQYFEQVRQQPNLQQWDPVERDSFSAWIIDTLAQRAAVDGKPSYKVQAYLESVRAHFFPMIRRPERAASLQLPASVLDFKRLLYENDIGYKSTGTDDGKLFVQRYYKLPALLFPAEMIAERLMADPQHAQRLLEQAEEDAEGDGAAALLREMQQAGCDKESLPDVKAQLQEYLDKYNLSMPDYSSSDGETSHMAALDDILNSAYEDKLDTASSSNGVTSSSALEDDDRSNSDSSSSSDSDSDDEARSATGRRRGRYSQQEWDGLVSKYKKPAVTELEQQRDRIYSVFEHNLLENASSESDLKYFQAIRMENSIIAHARMEREFNRKEAARREREWRRRGVWLEDMPNPTLPLL